MTSALPRGLARIRDVVMSLQLLLPVFLITNKCINLDFLLVAKYDTRKIRTKRSMNMENKNLVILLYKTNLAKVKLCAGF